MSDKRTKKDLIVELEMYKGIVQNLSKKINDNETLFFRSSLFSSIKSLFKERRMFKSREGFMLFLMERLEKENEMSKE